MEHGSGLIRTQELHGTLETFYWKVCLMAKENQDLSNENRTTEIVEHLQNKQSVVPKQDQQMRRRLLANIGVKEAKSNSANLIILSCSAVNGWATIQLRSFLWLLDRLGIDYTYLHLPEKEYCCGWTTVRNSKDDEKVKSFDSSKNCIGLNIEQGRKIGPEGCLLLPLVQYSGPICIPRY